MYISVQLFAADPLLRVLSLDSVSAPRFHPACLLVMSLLPSVQREMGPDRAHWPLVANVKRKDLLKGYAGGAQMYISVYLFAADLLPGVMWGAG